MIAKRILLSQYSLRQINFITRNLKAKFSTSKQGLITEMNQVKQANRFYEEKDIVQATQHFERSLNILPFYQRGNSAYNQQFQEITLKLIICFAWKGQTAKISKLTQTIIQESKKIEIQLNSKFKTVIDTLSIVSKHQNILDNDIRKEIKDHYNKITSNKQRNKLELPKQLVKIHKNQQANTTDLQKYMYGQLRSSVAFIFTSLLLYPNFTFNQKYNKLCNTLLKNAQKSSQKNIIKPLSILITNLLRNKQFLQAQGMIKYCIDRKRQNIKLNMLKSNQQYILLNLLLAYTYEGVDRLSQSKQISQQYGKLFNLETYMVQNFLIDSF